MPLPAARLLLLCRELATLECATTIDEEVDQGILVVREELCDYDQPLPAEHLAAFSSPPFVSALAAACSNLVALRCHGSYDDEQQSTCVATSTILGDHARARQLPITDSLSLSASRHPEHPHTNCPSLC